MKYQALISDLDGTLIDSTHIYYEVAQQMCGRYSIPFTEETFVKHGGKQLEDWLREVGFEAGHILQFAEEYRALAWQLLSEKVEWIPGAADFSQRVKEKVPSAIATTSSASAVDIINTRVPIRTHFQDIITGDMNRKRCKPYPHSLHSARIAISKRIGKTLHPHECLYFGDNEVDVIAAHAAGMDVALKPNKHTHIDAHREGVILVAEYDEVLDRF